MKWFALAVLFVTSTVVCQDRPQPLSQVEACRNFRASIVQVDTDTMHGTGFIVAPDGWIMTALHVVADQQTLAKRENLSVSILGHPKAVPARIVTPIDNLARLRDFAILKIDETDLHALDLGSEIGVEDGSPIAIIGLPLSATFSIPAGSVVPRFCLSGTVAAQTAFPLGNLRYLHTVYFQGVSIKGISGAPIISLITGKVIGIVSTRLAGITVSLLGIKDELIAQPPGISIDGYDPGGTTIQIIDVLDTQLANGLGSGTGASDAANALREAKTTYKKPK
jgi:S1-C subfamily serine protease